MRRTWSAVKETLSLVWRDWKELLVWGDKFQHMADYPIPLQILCFFMWALAWTTLIGLSLAVISAVVFVVGMVV